MEELTFQIQELIESLDHLYQEQQYLLKRNHINDMNHIGSLPHQELREYQRLQRERKAKGAFLASLAGTEDDLKILLGQLSRLTTKRERLLRSRQTKNPLELPIDELTNYTQLWAKSDVIAGLVERLCRNPTLTVLNCGFG